MRSEKLESVVTQEYTCNSCCATATRFVRGTARATPCELLLDELVRVEDA